MNKKTNKEKQYFIKIGKMYVTDIYVNFAYVKTNFVYGIDLSAIQDDANKFNENEMPKTLEILKDIFNTENEDSEITIEEVKKDE